VLNLVGLSSDSIVSIYFGSARTLSDAQAIASELENEYPGIQVDIIESGQFHQEYLASVE
jgi:dihydroxyacetone kinase-like predicted kinase